MNQNQFDILIIGGAIAGLAAAKKCFQLGLTFHLIEASDRLGGILKNFSIEGFTFDHAVHLSFATEKEVRREFDKKPYFDLAPRAMCYADGGWFKHPIQNNLFSLSPREKVACIESFLEKSSVDETNFEQWLISQYGSEIAERFHLRYNNKYWDVSLAGMSTDWISNRLRQPDFSEILEGTYHERTQNDYYVDEMRYPETGGYQGFIEDLINQIDGSCSLNERITKIEPENKVVFTCKGNVFQYSRLVSSIPLPLYGNLIKNMPPVLRSACNSLTWTSVDLTSVGIKRHIDMPLWFYIYDEDVMAARCHSPSRKSKNNVPDGASSIQFEVYRSKTLSNLNEKADRETQILHANNALNFLKLNFDINVDDIQFTDFRSLQFGNVVFQHDTNMNSDKIREWLHDSSITTCGRFGEWKYLWSNQAYMSGFNAV